VLTRALLFTLAAVTVWAGGPATCPAGSPIGLFQLQVKPPNPGLLIPLPDINRIVPGSELVYSPAVHPFANFRDAKIALVLLPADKSPLQVLEGKPAAAVNEWPVSHPLSVVALVWGPDGLDRRKVESLVAKNREIIEQLADYASRTEQTEALLAALTSRESGNPTEDVEATLSGFGTQYNTAARIDRSAALDQQTLAAMHGLNPALSAYDPLASQSSQKLQQSAGIAASVASLFFGNGVGLAAGSGALFVNLRTLFFPRTEFRSAFTQKTEHDELVLCGKAGASQARTRLAYLWAARVPNSPPPSLTIPKPAHIAIGVTSPIPLHVANGDWSQILRAHGWMLISADGKNELSTPVTADKDKKMIEVNLANIKLPPGDYFLRAKWDWDDLPVAGQVHVHQLTDLSGVRLTPASQDCLIAGAGKVQIDLAGADFEFVQKLALKDPRERYAVPTPLNFTLSSGLRGGPQRRLEAEIDTRNIQPGDYELLLTQVDAKTQKASVKVLPPPPQLKIRPLRLNLGEHSQEVILHGTGLDRIEKIEADKTEINLGPAGGGDHRAITVKLSEHAKKGEWIGFHVMVQNMDAPIVWKDAAEIVGPRPRIDRVETSLPADLGVGLRAGELPSGAFVNFVLSAHNFTPSSSLMLSCTEDSLTLQPLSIHVGDRQGNATLRSATPESLFLSLDPGTVGQSGCTLAATLANRIEGQSDAKALGKIVRLPRIESFQLTDEKSGESNYVGILKGQDLELIAKVGWDISNGLAVDALPSPVAGQPLGQSLRILLPWPSPAPHAPLYIWLRGEAQGRPTAVKY